MSTPSELGRKIRLLVVDDSPTVRMLVTRSLVDDPEIEVVAGAADPYEARDRILELQPDVMTLDLEMPRMDGLTFLRILMQKKPMPVVVMSSLTQKGSDLALEALQCGAVDVLAKPYGSNSTALLGRQLAERVKMAVGCRVRLPGQAGAGPKIGSSDAPAVIKGRLHPKQIILLGASTGGTEALRDVLLRLPSNCPPIAIVQHIPAGFSRAFAERMNKTCKMEVREAVHGDVLRTGLALIAPGDYHMTIRWNGANYEAGLRQGPPVWHQRPAVDILFKSAVEDAGKHAVVGLLTGMGRDGADGMLKLKEAGAFTVAQDEATCVVYGMPKAAVELGAAMKIAPLLKIPHLLAQALADASPTPERVTR
jgi:two-component system, chemotaxis family, protein-glutamate methylesterase/glutaminase